jgi:Family of unknown function (DUF6152)
MRRIAILAVLTGLTAGVTPVSAHHSFAATYFENKTMTIEGKLVQFLYRNPHSFVHVQVENKDKPGVIDRWAVEWGGGGQLSRDGITAQTLRPGDFVKITGNPGRNPEDHRLRMQSINRPSDGFTWKGVVE